MLRDFIRRMADGWHADFGRHLAVSEHLPGFTAADLARHKTATLASARDELHRRLAMVEGELRRREAAEAGSVPAVRH